MRDSYQAGPDIQVIPSDLPIPGLGLQAVNAFLVRGAEPFLVDTGMPVDRAAFQEALWSLIDPADLRWVVVTHDDRDHTGSLPAILEAAPQARLITNPISLTRLGEEFHIPGERVVTVNPGGTWKLPDRTISFHRPPTYDSPGTVALFDHSDGTLYSSDSFGTVVAEPAQHLSEIPEDEFFSGFSILNRAIAPWTAMAGEEKFRRGLAKIAGLRPARLLSAHGPTVEGRVDDLFAAMSEIPSLPAWLADADLDLDAALVAHEAESSLRS
ncbi:MBL fold metallo-hydrolase [Kitasatospora sp. NPDC094015]|uniref:MBL fold metallo-hydrolase n=1 Tax=Kitasatospora sp. NPDC094015 TaxID=3155205 RepID=UPI0033168642